MIHLTLHQISAYLDAELPEASVELVRLHLSGCLECTERFAQLEEQDEVLGKLLVSDPGDAFFDGLLDRVLRASKETAPPKTASPGSRSQATPTPPATPATPAAPATPVPPTPPIRGVASGPSQRPAAIPAAVRTEPASMPHAPAQRARQSKPPARRPGVGRALIPFLAIAVIATSAAVVMTRFGPDVRSLFGWSLRAGRGTTAAPEPPSVSDASAPALLSPDPLERAAASGALATRTRTAEAYDAAAAAWEEALPGLQDPEELAAGRGEVASARYQAWSLEATPERRQAATAAVRSYLLCAPTGPRRDLAWAWLARLKR